MSSKITTPLTGSIVGLFTYFSFESLLSSIVVAFCSGIAAWLGKLVIQSLFRFFRNLTKQDKL